MSTASGVLLAVITLSVSISYEPIQPPRRRYCSIVRAGCALKQNSEPHRPSRPSMSGNPTSMVTRVDLPSFGSLHAFTAILDCDGLEFFVQRQLFGQRIP